MLDPDETTEDETVPPPAVPLDALDDEGLDLDPEAPAEVVAAILDASTPAAPAVEIEPRAEPAAIEPDDALERAVDRLGDRIEQRLAGLQAQFEREVRAEANRERVVDRLHAELQEYKQDLLLKVQRPIFIDLIQLHDDVGKMAAAQSGDGALEVVRDLFASIQTAVEDILYRQGVEPFRAEAENFDPRRQRALATEPTEEPALAKTIAQRLRPGFQAGDRIIRPELVRVYTLKSDQRSAEEPAAEGLGGAGPPSA